jgi:hypothetical protein
VFVASRRTSLIWYVSHAEVWTPAAAIGGLGTVMLRTRGGVRRRPGSGLTGLAWWGRVARWLLHELL